MSFFLLLLYITLAYLRPWDFFPELESLRLGFWIGNTALGLSVGRFLFRGSPTLMRGPEMWLFFAFVVIVAVSRVLAEAWFGGAIETMEAFMPTLIICTLIFLNVDTLRKLKVLAAVVILASLTLVIFGVRAYHYGVNEEMFVMAQRSDGVTEDGQRRILGRLRALGSLNDPNDFGQALISVMPWLWPLWRSGRTLRNLVLIVLPTALFMYGIFLTRSRGAVLAVLVVVLVQMRDRLTRFRLAVPLIATAVIGFGLLAAGGTGGRDISADDESAAGRLGAWRAGLKMLQEKPLTGVGFRRFPDHHDGLAAHNSFVNCFAELGIVGYFCWIGLLLVLYQRLGIIRGIEIVDGPSAEISAWASALYASFFGCLTAGFFLSRTYAPTVYMVLGVIMSLHVVAQGIEEPPSPMLGPFIGRTAMITLGSIVGIYILVRTAGF